MCLIHIQKWVGREERMFVCVLKIWSLLLFFNLIYTYILFFSIIVNNLLWYRLVFLQYLFSLALVETIKDLSDYQDLPVHTLSSLFWIYIYCYLLYLFSQLFHIFTYIHTITTNSHFKSFLIPSRFIITLPSVSYITSLSLYLIQHANHH